MTKGSVSRKVESGNGAGRPVAYISGNTGAGYDFGKIMTSDFSICSVTRYLGGSKGRILQTNHPNWLHGHWGGRAGVAHYGTWVTPHEGPSSTDWLVMLGSSVVPVWPLWVPGCSGINVTSTKKAPLPNNRGTKDVWQPCRSCFQGSREKEHRNPARRQPRRLPSVCQRGLSRVVRLWRHGDHGLESPVDGR